LCEVGDFRKSFKPRGLIVQLRQPKPRRGVDANEPVRCHRGAALLQGFASTRTDEARDQRHQQLRPLIIVGNVVVPRPHECGKNRTCTFGMIRPRLAGDVRNRLHHAHAGAHLVVSANVEALNLRKTFLVYLYMHIFLSVSPAWGMCYACASSRNLASAASASALLLKFHVPTMISPCP
jgi:hypothetical protein